MDALLAALQWIADFFGGGIVTLIKDSWAWMLQKAIVWWIDLKIEFMKFAWGIAKSILEDLQVGQRINDALVQLPDQVRAALNFFRVPEAATNIITAYVSRFVMRFIPG